MKPRVNDSTKPFDATVSAPNYLGVIPKESFPSAEAPVKFPHFPSVKELSDHQSGIAKSPLLELTESPRPVSSPSIFQALLGGRIDVLIQDALDNPSRYEETTRDALMALVSKKPEERTPADLQALNDATLDFAAFRKPKATTLIATPKPAPVKRPQLMDTEAPYDNRAPQGEEPGGVMSSYWWL